MKLFHSVNLREGLTLIVPSSIPTSLQSFVKTNHLVKNDEMESFKNLVHKNK